MPFDVVFSNAALQWIADHGRVVSGLFAQVAPGGALAFQIPSRRFAQVRVHIHEIANDPAWAERMQAAKAALTMEVPSYYYDVLSYQARVVDIWETEYSHVMDAPSSIVDSMASTGLRPFLDRLDTDSQRSRFVNLLTARITESYPRRRDGKVLFPFSRLFVVAYR